MGTQTLGSTTPNTSHSASWNYSGENIMGGGVFTMPQDGYIDTINVYFASYSGTTSNVQFVIWQSSTLYVAGNTSAINVNNTAAYKTGTFPAGSYLYLPSGYQFQVGISAGSGGVTFWMYSTGNNYAKTGTSGPVGMSGATANQFINGDTNSYVTYFPPASVSSLSASVVNESGTFTVTGLSFTAGISSVTIGGVAAAGWSVVNDTTLSVTAPASACQGTVTVNTYAGSATSAASITVVNAPVITGVSPSAAPAGTNITITGTNFNYVSSVTIGGVAASYTVNSSTQITATVPAGVTGSVTVVVTNPAGSGSWGIIAGQIWYGTGTSVGAITAIWYGTGTSVAKIAGVWVNRSGTITNIW
jgi:hypothetical protein